jgi:uncharacterized protein (DUF1499 family)
MAAQRTNLGVADGKLAPCPDTPNCVSSQSDDERHYLPPIPYSAPQAEAQSRLMGLIRSMPRTTIIAEEPGYIHVVFRSRVFRFPDDVEFYFDDAAHVIHFRSAARLGTYDLGVNRKRMQRITQTFTSDTSGD